MENAPFARKEYPMKTRLLLAACATLAFAFAVSAHDHKTMGGMDMGAKIEGGSPMINVANMELSNGMVKGMLPGQAVGGGFITLTNEGKEDDRLISAATPNADHVEIHEMTMENDVMKMRQLKDGLPIKAGETVELMPGGFHLMFFGVKAPFRAGETVPVTLTFEKAGKVDVSLPVIDPSKFTKGHMKM